MTSPSVTARPATVASCRRARLWLAVVACSLPLTAPAQTMASDDAARSGGQSSGDQSSSEQSSAASDTTALETITVVGQAARIRSALNQQREAENLETVVNSDAINALPDKNVSESLQRLPGLSVERDQGEGRFVRVRGTSADLNTVTVNGTQLPAPEADRRAVALDVLPSDLLSSLVVTKALTPDMDANSIGGNIELKSVSALDKDRPFFKASVEGSYNELTDQTSPGGSVSGGRTFDFDNGQRLGVAGALSWEKRKFGSENVETGGAWDFDEDPATLEELEQRDYNITRERLGAALNLDYELDPDNRVYLHTLYSRYSDTEERWAHIVEFDEPQTPGESGDAEAARELKSREETQEILSATLGAEHHLRDWTIEYSASASEASEENPDEINATFAGNDTFSGVGYTGTVSPDISAPASFYAADSYTLDEVEQTESDATDRQNSARFDITRHLSIDNNPARIKFGAKASRRKKENDENVWVYEDLDDANANTGASALRSMIAAQGQAGNEDEEGSRVNDYRIDEDINAGYLMGSINIRGLNILTGARYEHTDTDARGTRLEDGTFSDRRVENSYGNLLGYFHTRYELTDSTQVRAAFTQSIARPTFEQLSPAYVIDGDEAEFGNPDLDPMESNNIDLGIEHYFGPDSAVSAYIFYKDIQNFVYTRDLAGTGDFAAFDEAITYRNGEDATLRGLEVAINHKFSRLPAPWNGLLIGANAAWTRSDATIETSAGDRDISLPGQSDTTGNLTLGYEDDRLSLRLAGNYKSDYLMEVSDPDDARYDVYQDDQFQLDFSAGYFVTENLQVQFDAVNITDEPYYTYAGSSDYNAQYETYGRTYRLGLTYTNF
nr:TonB-dependent receptor [Marinobacter sp. JSM 1782161]